MEKYGWSEIFNTDQGCQFTSEQFTNIFNSEFCSTRLSMDGKDRAFDNIFVERFCRTLKYEDIY
ncbi:MAG: transposase family protein [Fibrobacter sp.]|nr:transposase family protein [Fibrobacter sp.]